MDGEAPQDADDRPYAFADTDDLTNELLQRSFAGVILLSRVQHGASKPEHYLRVAGDTVTQVGLLETYKARMVSDDMVRGIARLLQGGGGDGIA